MLESKQQHKKNFEVFLLVGMRGILLGLKRRLRTKQ